MLCFLHELCKNIAFLFTLIGRFKIPWPYTWWMVDGRFQSVSSSSFCDRGPSNAKKGLLLMSDAQVVQYWSLEHKVWRNPSWGTEFFQGRRGPLASAITGLGRKIPRYGSNEFPSDPHRVFHKVGHTVSWRDGGKVQGTVHALSPPIYRESRFQAVKEGPNLFLSYESAKQLRVWIWVAKNKNVQTNARAF